MGKSLHVLIVFLLYQTATAQVMIVETRPSDSEFAPEKVWQCEEKDCQESIDDLQKLALSEGYLLPTLQKRWRNDTLFVTLTLGPLFKSGVFSTRNVPLHLKIKFGLDSIGTPFSPNKLEKLYAEILSHYEDSGYPFATVVLDSITMVSNVFSGRVNVEKGDQIKFGEIREKNGMIRSGWLVRYLPTKSGELFSQEEVDKIPGLLASLGFSLLATPQIEFQENRANILLEIESELNAELDGIMGLQQHPVTGKNLLSGYLDLTINNLFRSAKMLDLHWERLRLGTQELQVNYGHPGITQSSELLLAFSLLKIDTSYLNVESELNWNFQTRENWTFTLGGRLRSGSVLNREVIMNQPISGDFTHGDFMSAITFRGDRWSVDSRVYVGRKKTTGTSDIPPGLFNSDGGSALQLGWKSSVGHIQPFATNFSLVQKFDLGLLYSKTLFFNDYFLLGGLQSVRGFNERSIFTDQYLQLRSELRFSLGELSYLLSVLDVARVHDPLIEEQLFLTGFGAGIDLAAGKATRFRLLVAWGRSGRSKIDFSNTKVHIGYLSKF